MSGLTPRHALADLIVEIGSGQTMGHGGASRGVASSLSHLALRIEQLGDVTPEGRRRLSEAFSLLAEMVEP